MKVRFVGHASILVECRNQRILCDPWFVSKVFNNSWALITPPGPPCLSDVDCIWISHEHPDHFNFPTLKSISAADKSRIKVLYQKHASPRVVDALIKLGFAHIIELPLYQWIRLTPELELFCGSVGSMDSFIAIRDEQNCILNINDCVLNEDQLRYVKWCIGDVSVLFTQFSFANWVGNDSDEAHGASRKIVQLTQQIDILKPVFTVPTASFIYFCNEENYRMNAWMNTPDTIARLNLRGVNFMYPGDEWFSHSKTFHSECALEKYRADYANMPIDPTPDAVDIEQVSQAVRKCLQETSSRVPDPLLKKLPPFAIYMHDLDRILEVDPAHSVYRIFEGDAQQKQDARYVMCGQAAWFAFAFSFGGNTTLISGMYRDRQFAQKGWADGWSPFFRLQDKLSTEVFRHSGTKDTLRTLNFWWRKKGEKVFQYTGAFRGQNATED